MNDYLLIKPDENEYVDENPNVVRILKEGTIILPEAYEGALKKSPMTGKVVTWGDKCRYSFLAGDHVIFSRFSGAPFYMGDVKYLLIVERDLLAKLEDD